MIGSWVGSGGHAGRSRRAALLVGLVLVIAAHLTGAVHACSFAGADPSAVVARDVAHPADGAGGGMVPPPGHRHAADGHLGHTADRPRAALDDTGLDGEPPEPALPAASRGRPAPTGWSRRAGVRGSHGKASSLAVVRVLRQ
ncbi:hypothetical protein [Streptomyces sp. Caat 7-52]|uniref:hypothetical protein n=1 Tax=Streptomyces sp. Caat 7-52 TaxID=2949637 RepID=UPI0020358D9F|nr:hypothetical protein [Streptomyces sp. Caat 7-52]